ncbi:MAG TPA: helix-turn-helix domain-containing protein, partial [Thermoanaerobaculia bacterium]|nr:helix-turn-helix domain-containing protein [Thermoanaerobaculia bacterium]
MSVSPIIRPTQAARLLGISRATLYRWEGSGRLAPRVILGPNTSGWREEDLAAFIRDRLRRPFRVEAGLQKAMETCFPLVCREQE